MTTSLIVIDDFLDEPQRMRADALRLDYPDLKGPFPGRNSRQRLELPGLTESVARFTGERLRPLDPPMSHMKCRLTLASDPVDAQVHIDPGYWSGILYLSRPEDCRGGTRFYRHRRTGTERAPLTQAECEAMGFADARAMQQAMIERDGVDPAAWEQVMEVPMRFNRLVLLRPWLWHTAGPGFGDRPENGRLIYVMFFLPAA
jgi:hypothetical protein